MAYGTRVAFDSIRELAFGSISGSYAALGSVLSDNARIITFQNATNEEVYISFDGSTDHLRLAANSFKLFDFSSNKIRDDGWFLSVGTQISAKYVSTLGTSGNIWAEVIYAEGGV